jgi:hypothetical protein
MSLCTSLSTQVGHCFVFAKNHALTGFEPGLSVPQADHCATPPGHYCSFVALWPIYMNSDFDSVGCDSRIQHRTKIGLFLSLDAAVASDTVKITVRLNRPLPCLLYYMEC